MLVEGVEYDINWSAFLPGRSVFFPCLNPDEARKAVIPVFQRLKMRVVTKVTIEEGVRGLRVWRM